MAAAHIAACLLSLSRLCAHPNYMRRGSCVRARDGEREELKTTLLYQHSIVLAGALLTICGMTAFAALLTLCRSSARSNRRCCGAVVVWRPALGFAFAKHFKTRAVPVCSFVVPASREDVAFGHLTLIRMLTAPPQALALRPG